MDIDHKAKKILNQLREKAEASVDGAMYGDRFRALRDIDALLSEPSIKGVKYLLLPTATFKSYPLKMAGVKNLMVLPASWKACWALNSMKLIIRLHTPNKALKSLTSLAGRGQSPPLNQTLSLPEV